MRSSGSLEIEQVGAHGALIQHEAGHCPDAQADALTALGEDFLDTGARQDQPADDHGRALMGVAMGNRRLPQKVRAAMSPLNSVTPISRMSAGQQERARMTAGPALRAAANRGRGVH